MKKIVDSQRLLGVTKETELKELKTVYRNFMKEYHPDKFQDDILKQEAEEKSKTIIEAYHFLVSIAPETIAQSSEQYKLTTSTSSIVDYEYKSQTLKITFADGSIYEYFDVPKGIFTKMVNSDSVARFAKRHVYNSFVFRNVSKLTTDSV
jgi:curved DNA-binding protein CbpA